MKHPQEGSGAADAAPGPSEELVLPYGGHLRVHREPVFELPPFEFSSSFGTPLASRMWNDYQWSQRIAPTPISPVIVTGI